MDPASSRPDRLERDLLEVNTIRAAYPGPDTQTALWIAAVVTTAELAASGHDSTRASRRPVIVVSLVTNSAPDAAVPPGAG
jgi:hypothetical protein